MLYFLIIIISYIIGSSNMAFYLSKLSKKDIRNNGSGNLGASNAVISLGWKAGLLTGIHDIGKAIVTVLLAKLLFDVPYAGIIAGVSCVLGHIFPFYLKFKGGKGLASYIGMTIAMDWKLGIGIVLLLCLITLLTDYIVIGTLATIIAVPIVTLFFSWISALTIFVASFVIFVKHLENYKRILNGTEIGFRNAIKGKYKM